MCQENTYDPLLCTYAYLLVRMYVYMYVYMYACMYLCMYANKRSMQV